VSESKKPHPHFTFSVLATEKPEDTIELTNSFLVIPSFNQTHDIWGCLATPIELKQTNVILRFGISSPAFAQDAQIVVVLPKDWNAVPDPHWEIWDANDIPEISLDSRGATTNKYRAWIYRVPSAMLPGNSIGLPPILIPQIPNSSFGEIGQGDIGIWAQAKDWPPEGIAFQTYFFSFPTNAVSKPVMVKPKVARIEKTDANKNMLTLVFPNVETNKLQK